MSGIEKALRSIRLLPRVALNNIRQLPQSTKKRPRKKRGQHGGKTCGFGHKGQRQHGTLPRVGFEGDQTPFYLKMPIEPFYKGHHLCREYKPFSLMELQRMIDLGRIDPKEPIDLTTISINSHLRLEPNKRQYGVELTDEGGDIFEAKVNIEVQRASEQTIAAVERNGGVITTRFYDLLALHAVVDPLKFFKRGIAIPRCKLPPQKDIEYYSSADNRGYLADPELLRQARIELAQKYGYILPDLSEDELYKMLSVKKDPRQVFLGLRPGWVVNIKDRKILKPTDPDLIKYYES